MNTWTLNEAQRRTMHDALVAGFVSAEIRPCACKHVGHPCHRCASLTKINTALALIDGKPMVPPSDVAPIGEERNAHP